MTNSRDYARACSRDAGRRDGKSSIIPHVTQRRYNLLARKLYVINFHTFQFRADSIISKIIPFFFCRQLYNDDVIYETIKRTEIKKLLVNRIPTKGRMVSNDESNTTVLLILFISNINKLIPIQNV